MFLINADLSESSLPSKLYLIKSMKKAILNKTKFYSNSELNGLNVEDGEWKHAEILYANLSRAELKNLDLTGTNLTGTDLSEAGLSGSNMKNATLKNVNLTRADVSGVKKLTVEQLIEAKSLYNIKGLNQRIKEELIAKNPNLFESND